MAIRGVVVLGSALAAWGLHCSTCASLVVARMVHGLSGSSWDLSYPTRDQTLAPCIGSMESYPLNYQVSPWMQDMNESRLHFLVCRRGLISQKLRTCWELVLSVLSLFTV